MILVIIISQNEIYRQTKCSDSGEVLWIQRSGKTKHQITQTAFQWLFHLWYPPMIFHLWYPPAPSSAPKTKRAGAARGDLSLSGCMYSSQQSPSHLRYHFAPERQDSVDVFEGEGIWTILFNTYINITAMVKALDWAKKNHTYCFSRLLLWSDEINSAPSSHHFIYVLLKFKNLAAPCLHHCGFERAGHSLKWSDCRVVAPDNHHHDHDKGPNHHCDDGDDDDNDDDWSPAENIACLLQGSRGRICVG